MERLIYERMAQHDDFHWWYRGRRAVLSSYIARSGNLPLNARVLEIGCGTGHNLSMLAQFGTVSAVEIDYISRTIASERLGKPVIDNSLPDLVDVERRSFDLVAVLDVIEHVKDDVAALRSIASCLRPSGKVLITVPAHPWMWSSHDEANHHFRRYSRSSLQQAIATAGLITDKPRYFNSILFPLAVARRLSARIMGEEGGDDSPPPRPINRLFERVFASERHAMGRIHLPIGLSLATFATLP
jgi:SAM-dependent methyltransferase